MKEKERKEKERKRKERKEKERKETFWRFWDLLFLQTILFLWFLFISDILDVDKRDRVGLRDGERVRIGETVGFLGVGRGCGLGGGKGRGRVSQIGGRSRIGDRGGGGRSGGGRRVIFDKVLKMFEVLFHLRRERNFIIDIPEVEKPLELL